MDSMVNLTQILLSVVVVAAVKMMLVMDVMMVVEVVNLVELKLSFQMVQTRVL